MQPTLCSRCKKNVAVIFITRIENGESHNEGLCLRCARELHIKPVDEMMEKLGISDADLDNLTGDVAEMLGSMGMLGGDGAADADADASDADTDEDDGKTATFPFLNKLFGAAGQDNVPAAPEPEKTESRQRAAGIRLHVAPGDLHAAALRLQKAEQAAEQRAFSHAVRAEHGDALALVRAEADALQHVRAAVGEDKVLHVNLHHAASLL